MIESNKELDIARAVVLRTQNPGIAALQAQLRLGHVAASALIARLRDEHTILCTWKGRQPGIHPDHRRVHVQSIKGDVRLNYIERVAQLALFYFELAEEDSNAHSEAVIAQLPAGGLAWGQVQELFRREWYGAGKMTLTDAALAFHVWLRQHGAVPDALGGVEAGIRARCLPYERSFTPVTDAAQRLDRAYVRMARFFRRTVREDFSEHSRVVEWFVGDSVVPQNKWMAGLHGEHVVPCAVLRNLSVQCFADQRSVRQVADLLRRLLVVIWIGQTDKKLLDNGPRNLRSTMPPGWLVETGCLYARLHSKGIRFEPAQGYPCSCAAI